MRLLAPKTGHDHLHHAPVGEFDELLQQLGKHKTGKSCLYINLLSDVDLQVLETLVARSVAWMKTKYQA